MRPNKKEFVELYGIFVVNHIDVLRVYQKMKFDFTICLDSVDMYFEHIFKLSEIRKFIKQTFPRLNNLRRLIYGCFFIFTLLAILAYLVITFGLYIFLLILVLFLVLIFRKLLY